MLNFDEDGEPVFNYVQMITAIDLLKSVEAEMKVAIEETHKLRELLAPAIERVPEAADYFDELTMRRDKLLLETERFLAIEFVNEIVEWANSPRDESLDDEE